MSATLHVRFKAVDFYAPLERILARLRLINASVQRLEAAQDPDAGYAVILVLHMADPRWSGLSDRMQQIAGVTSVEVEHHPGSRSAGRTVEMFEAQPILAKGRH